MNVVGQNSVTKFWIISFLLILTCLSSTMVEAVSVIGKATVSYKSGVFSNDPKQGDKDKALEQAKNSAWGKYIGKFSQAKLKNYRMVESDITSRIDDYIINLSIIDENVNSDTKKYRVVIKMIINDNELDAKIKSVSTANNENSGEGSSFSFIFVAREAASVKTFDKKIVQISSGEVNTYEKENVAQDGNSTLVSTDQKVVEKSTTGGSTTQKGEVISYRILSSGNVDAAMTQVLSTSGFEVISYDDVVGACGGPEPEEIHEHFVVNDKMPRKVRTAAIRAARSEDCEIKIWAYGTLDAGVATTDPTTGNKRVYVTVRAQVYNISKKLPKTIASVGPVQHQGIGPDGTVAKNNALKLAAEKAANEIVEQLNAKGIF